MSKSISTPNYDKIAQSTAELLLLLNCENGLRHIGIILPVSM